MICIAEFRRTGSRVEAKCWLARVPSYSNIAHKPSPGMVHELLAAGWCKDEFAQVFFAVEHRVAFMRKKWGKGANALLCSPGEKSVSALQLLSRERRTEINDRHM